jgi:hypothetical protein
MFPDGRRLSLSHHGKEKEELCVNCLWMKYISLPVVAHSIRIMAIRADSCPAGATEVAELVAVVHPGAATATENTDIQARWPEFCEALMEPAFARIVTTRHLSESSRTHFQVDLTSAIERRQHREELAAATEHRGKT